MLCWGETRSNSNNQTINLPISYNDNYKILLTTINSHYGCVTASYENGDAGLYKTLSTFSLSYSAHASGISSGAYWFTIGY